MGRITASMTAETQMTTPEAGAEGEGELAQCYVSVPATKLRPPG